MSTPPIIQNNAATGPARKGRKAPDKESPRKVCAFCAKIAVTTYKDISRLKKF